MPSSANLLVSSSVIKGLIRSSRFPSRTSARLYELERSRIDQERSQDRKSKIGTGDRSERIRTYNFPQGRVTDHRINLTLHKLDEFLEGEAFDEMIESLTLQAQEESLKSL